MKSKTIFDVKKAARQITYDMRPAGELDVAVLDGLPLEAVEEEDDGHDQGRHHAPRHGPVQIRSEILKVLSNGNSGGSKLVSIDSL